MRFCLLPLMLLVGCAASPPPQLQQPSAAARTDDDAHGPGDTLGSEDGSALNLYYDSDGRLIDPWRSVSIDRQGAADRYQVRSLATPAPARQPRPRRVGKRDIRLHRAGLDNAFRLLAREGRFNVVVQGEMAKPVSLELRAVEPYDALLALAEANGIAVRYRGNIVIVSTR